MKMRRIYCFVLMALMLMLSACSSSKSNTQYSTAGSAGQSVNEAEYGGYTNGIVEESTSASENPTSADYTTKDTSNTSDTTGSSSDTSRKRIRRLSLNLESLDFNKSLKTITDEIQKSGGYVERSSINGNSAEDSGYRSAQFVLRIPVDKTDSFVQIMGSSMNLVHKEEDSEDITLKYVDTESKVKALKIEQERLLAILEKTVKIEDIIALEGRLSEVRYQLEQNASTLRTYDNLVEYSTVTLNIDEVLRISPPEHKGTFSKMKTGLSNSLLNMRDTFLDVAVWLVANLPYLIFWGLVIGLSVLISMKVINKKEKKRTIVPAVNTDKEKKEEGKNS